MYTKPGGRQTDQYLVQVFTGAEGSVDSYTALFLCILYLKGLNRLILFSPTICMASPLQL